MRTLLLMRGLPGSGKTTLAREWVAKDPTCRVRVNRDEMRALMFGQDGVLPHAQEEAVTVAQRAWVSAMLAAGWDVVVDDMNLRLKYARAWLALAEEHGAFLQVEDVLTSVETCVERDWRRAQRGGRHVSEPVIREIAARFPVGRWPDVVAVPTAAEPVEQYVMDVRKPPTILIDVDGTVALMNGRSPYDYARVSEDGPFQAVIDIARGLQRAGYELVFMSARDDSCHDDTLRWLLKHDLRPSKLVMRTTGDVRKDAIVKAEMFFEHVAPYFAVVAVLDDRDQVVRMWRSLGLTCLQVAPGAF